MKRFYSIIVMLFSFALPLTSFAEDIDVVKAFYTDLLSDPNAEDVEDRAARVVAEKWVSIPTPRGGPDRVGLVETLKGFGAAIPDLKWEIQEILNDGNRYIVRSIATGTPAAPMFGIDPPTGKSFEIMTIDIHTVEEGLISQSYHVEEWLKAVHQLKAE